MGQKVRKQSRTQCQKMARHLHLFYKYFCYAGNTNKSLLEACLAVLGFLDFLIRLWVLPGPPQALLNVLVPAVAR